LSDNYKSISVIIPVRNEEFYIANLLDSIISTSYPHDHLQVIVVDGMSEDNTWHIIERYLKQNPSIIAIQNQSQIVSTGFNLALNLCNGDYIFRIDGHCEISADYFEKCIKVFESQDADIVGGSLETVSAGLIGSAIAIAQSSLFGVGGVKFRNSNYNKSNYVDTLAFGGHKREIFTEIGGYDEEMVCNQDDEFNHRSIQAGKKIWLDAKIKTKYYSRSAYRKLFKQYFNYGCYKIRGMQKRRELISIRHLIPIIFVIALIGTIIFGYLLHQSWILFSVISVYLITNMISTFMVSQKISHILLIFLSFCILHISYGFGSMWGLLRFIGKWKDNILKDDHFNRDNFIANSVVPK